MKVTKLKTILVLVLLAAGLFAAGCSSKKGLTGTPDLETQLRDRDQKISELESSLGSAEADLKRASAEAKAKADAAAAADKAARAAEERARAAEKTARDSAGKAPAAPTMMAGSGLLPPAKPGECYARVFVPPTYRTETETMLKREASERVEIIPAKHETVDERILVKEASARMEEIPAKYDWVEEKILVKEAQTVWKKGRGPIEKVDNATGEIMCLVEVPASYKTVKKRILKSPATTRKVEIPAEYKTIKVRKMVTPPQERRIEIPAEYQTITKTLQATDGGLEWREILCETNMSSGTVSSIQRALKSAGHDPGPIDGVYGPQTRSAVRSYQKAKGLASGGLTISTIKKLGVRI